MFDVSWGEMMMIGGVALIVIGPKDLPGALRSVGAMTTKLRRMAGEFRSQFDDAMREAELDKVCDDLTGMADQARASGTGFNPIQTIRNEITEIRTSIEQPRSDLGRPDAAAADGVPAPIALAQPVLPPVSDAAPLDLTVAPVAEPLRKPRAKSTATSDAPLSQAASTTQINDPVVTQGPASADAAVAVDRKPVRRRKTASAE